MPVIGQLLTKYSAQAGGQVAPEGLAIEFYFLEHAAGIVRERRSGGAKLGELQGVMNRYNKRGAEIALRAFYYLLVI